MSVEQNNPLAPELDLVAMAAWLERHLPAEPGLRITEIKRPKSGFSAKTYLLSLEYSAGGKPQACRLVLRLEQPGHDIFLDTSIARQGEMMRALAVRGLPAPEVIGIETDRAVLGGQFLVTAHVEGQALPQHPSYQIAGLLHDLPPAGRHLLWSGAIRNIAKINRLDWREGFTFLNRPSYGPPGLQQYLGWLRAWAEEANNGQPHAVLDYATEYLRNHQPQTVCADVLWGDSNAGNMLFKPDGAVAAVLDFEAAAIGPGEIDLGWWFFMDDMLSFGVAKLPGLPDRAEQIAIYEAACGRQVRDLEYYEILAGVRMALVMVRTADRLVNFGILPPGNRSAYANPIVEVLAARLQISCEPTGADYMAMVMSMNTR